MNQLRITNYEMNNKTNKLIPELRFPEFVNEGEWVEKELGGIAENLDSKRVPITSNQREKGNIPYYGASGIIDYVKEYIYDENLLCISEDGANLIDRNYPIAFSISGKTWVNNHAHVLKFENSNTQLLVEKYINSINIEDFLTGMAQPKLNRGKLDIIPIPLPETPQEQQKIATCLSSLDEVIAAHSQKLEALKEHKKGLMQNLFPQEGETVPKLRFSEFVGDGEWVEKSLGDKEVSFFVSEKVTVKKLNINTYISTENMLSDFSGVSTASKLPSFGSFTKFTSGDILISNIRPYLKKVWKSNKIGGASNDVLVFRSGSEVLSEFLEFTLKNDSFINYVMKSAKGVKMPRGDKSSMQEYPVKYPNSNEQQKIASCLSSLDELITAQADKIEQLKWHKKGLMQGLFPSTTNKN